jgi:hypothetical protein
MHHPPSHGVKVALLEGQLLEGEIDSSTFLENASAFGPSAPTRLRQTSSSKAVRTVARPIFTVCTSKLPTFPRRR